MMDLSELKSTTKGMFTFNKHLTNKSDKSVTTKLVNLKMSFCQFIVD